MEWHRIVQNYKFYAITDEDKEVKYGLESSSYVLLNLL
jgi:hypothetical protein